MSEHYDIICPECKKRIGGCRCIGEPRTQQVADRPCEVCQAVKHLASTPTGDPQPGRFSMWVALSDVYGCTGTRNSEPTPEAIAEVEADGRRWIYMVESQGAPSPAPAGDLEAENGRAALAWMRAQAKALDSTVGDDWGPLYLSKVISQHITAPASPGTVQAPAAGPRVCNNGKVKVVFEGKAFHAVCSCGFRGPAAQLFGEALDGVWVKAHPGAGAPSAGRPMKLRARVISCTPSECNFILEIKEGKRWRLLGNWRAAFNKEMREAAYRINAFEGAGRPMTWTREGLIPMGIAVKHKGADCPADVYPTEKIARKLLAINLNAGNYAGPETKWETFPIYRLPETSASESAEAKPEPYKGNCSPGCFLPGGHDYACRLPDPGPEAPTPASGDTAPTLLTATEYRIVNNMPPPGAPIREAKAPADEDPTEGGKYVYCHGCSEAGGAGRAIYHLPPACGEAKADPGQGTGEG